MPTFNRRNFLKVSGLTVLPALLPAVAAAAPGKKEKLPPPGDGIIRFFGDGIMYDPAQYIEELRAINSKQLIEKDRYGTGGAMAALEKKFETITGKEKAMFMPSGTLANQLAIAVLSGENTKIFVQDTSHVYRDEADAAQSVFQKRLMPLAKGEAYFTAETLKNAVESLKDQEVFASGVGAVSVENPVRRSDGRMVPLEEIKKISGYCRSNNISLHLDGARIHMAAAWSGISIREYASLFDTIYVSLYKYLGASAGAMLCGEKKVMDKMPHLVKIHGGSMYGNWTNAAMALDRLEGVETRLGESIKRSVEVFAALNKIPGVAVTALDGGTNIYTLELPKETDGKKIQEVLNKQYNIRIPRPDDKHRTQLMVNETLLFRETDYITDAFRGAINAAKG